jgi:hypothetical protein
VTDWTPVLVAGVTGITGVVGGAIGYLIARSQAGVERAKISAENERLRIQQDLAYETERRLAYRAFLDSLYPFFLAGVGSQPFKDQDALNDFVSDENSCALAVQLFGTDAVRQAVFELDWFVGELLTAAGIDFTKIESVFGPRQQHWIDLHSAVVDAIREDVAPGGTAG